MLRNAIAPDLFDLLETGSAGDIDFYCQYARHCGGPVLVLLCGSGRVAIPIARQGVPVIGLDGDAGLIDLAKRKSAQAGAGRAMFVRGDPTHFVSDSKHPLVIIPTGGLQRLLTLEEQRRCLMAVRSALQIGGKLVLDLPMLEPAAAAAEQPVVRRQGAEGTAVIHRTRWYDAARQVVEELIRCDWLDQEGKVTGAQYASTSLRYATAGEVLLLLEACGFSATAYGGFDRRELMPGAARLLVEAERNA